MSCASLIQDLRVNLSAGLRGIPEDVAALETCMSHPAIAGGCALEDSPVIAGLTADVAAAREAAQRMWKRSMDMLGAAELTRACESLVQADTRALAAIAEAHARMGGASYDSAKVAALVKAVEDAMAATGEDLPAAGLEIVDAGAVAAPSSMAAHAPAAPSATQALPSSSASSSGPTTVSRIPMPVSSSVAPTAPAADVELDPAYCSPAHQRPAMRTPVRLVAGPPLSPVGGTGTPRMEDFGLSAAGLAALGGAGVDAAVTASARASVRRAEVSRSRTAVATDASDAGAAAAQQQQQQQQQQSAIPMLAGSTAGGGGSDSVADNKFFGAADAATADADAPQMRDVTAAELDDTPSYLKSPFPTVRDVNAAIRKINVHVIAQAAADDIQPADVRMAQRDMDAMFAAKSKGLILLLIHLHRLEVRREGRDTTYAIKE
jgi:hypothetical protein